MKTNRKGKAIVLFSGGLDSAVCLYMAKKLHQSVTALTFDYGQKHKVEIKKASLICKQTRIKQTVIRLPEKVITGSSLTDQDKKIPNYKKKSKGDIPSTYVPARNLLFLSFATSIAEASGANFIYIGVNNLDYSGYPDCRPEFIRAVQEAVRLGTKEGIQGKGIQIRTPLIGLKKKEIVIAAKKLGVPYSMTHSCYSPLRGRPCGVCDSCVYRSQGFLEAGIPDSKENK